MNRRNVLQRFTSAIIGAGFIASDPEGAWGAGEGMVSPDARYAFSRPLADGADYAPEHRKKLIREDGPLGGG
jgi:hypothetical protein